MKKHHDGFLGVCGLFAHKDNFLTSLLRNRGGRSISPAFLSALLVLLLSLAVWGGTAAAATEGAYNNFFGTGAGSNTSGNNYNSFFGGYAGYLNNTGNYNSFFGAAAGYSNTAGSGNSFFGGYAGLYNTTGGYNSFFGLSAGLNNTTGIYNSFFGRSAGYYNTTGYYNSFFGPSAGYSNQGESSNTFVGYYADLGGAPAGTINNATAIGARAYVSQPNSLVLGSIKDVHGAAASVNVGIGTPAPQRQLHLSGDNAVFRMDRSTDTAAFLMVRTDSSGNPMKTFVVGTNASGADNGEFIINDLGTAVSGAGARRMTIDNNGDVEFTGSVTAHGFTSSSSLAYKTNVRTYENALETVRQLRGVRFDWKDSGKPAVGLIAEEVEGVVPEIVAYDEKSGAATGLNYANLVGVLVEAIKEQQAKLDGQQKAMAEQQAKLDEQQVKHQTEMESLKKELDSLKAVQQAQLDRQQAEIENLKAVQQAKLDDLQAEMRR